MSTSRMISCRSIANFYLYKSLLTDHPPDFSLLLHIFPFPSPFHSLSHLCPKESLTWKRNSPTRTQNSPIRTRRQRSTLACSDRSDAALHSHKSESHDGPLKRIHPLGCGWCSKNFQTRRGLVKHLASC